MWYSERNSGKSYKSASGFLTSWCVWKWFGYETIGKMMTNQKKIPSNFRKPFETADRTCHTRNYSMMALVLCLAPSLKHAHQNPSRNILPDMLPRNNLTISGKYFVLGINIYIYIHDMYMYIYIYTWYSNFGAHPAACSTQNCSPVIKHYREIPHWDFSHVGWHREVLPCLLPGDEERSQSALVEIPDDVLGEALVL